MELMQYIEMINGNIPLEYKKQVRIRMNYYKRGVRIFNERKNMIIDEIREARKDIKIIEEELSKLRSDLYETQSKTKMKKIDRQIKDHLNIIEMTKIDKYHLEKQRQNINVRIQECKENMKKLAIC